MAQDAQQKSHPQRKDFDRFAELRLYRNAVREGLTGPWPEAAVLYDRALRALRERFACKEDELTLGKITTDFGECRAPLVFAFDARDKVTFELKLSTALDHFTVVDVADKRVVGVGIPVTEYDALASKLTDGIKRHWSSEAPSALPENASSTESEARGAPRS